MATAGIIGHNPSDGTKGSNCTYYRQHWETSRGSANLRKPSASASPPWGAERRVRFLEYYPLSESVLAALRLRVSSGFRY
jgi:hypothetical protein